MINNLNFLRRFLIIVVSSVLLLSITLISAEDISNGSSLLKVFSTSENSIERRAIVQSLNSITIQEGETAPEWARALLEKALGDQSPVVVAEAVKQIGRLGLEEFNTDLIALFKSADAHYGASGYAHRVQYAVIAALGKIGSREAKALVSDLLKDDTGSQMGMHLLTAIKDFNDPILLQDLKVYRNKMDSFVKESKGRGDDPLLYSRRLDYSRFATDIEKMLVAKGGK